MMIGTHEKVWRYILWVWLWRITPSVHRWVEMQTSTTLGERNLAIFSQTINILTFWSSNMTSRNVHWRRIFSNMKINMHKLFIVAVFVLAKYLKETRCPYIEEWLNKLWHIHKTEYQYHATVKNCGRATQS